MDRTCLDVGAHCGQADVVAFLLDHFLERGHQLPKVGPLHWAAKEGHEGVINILLRFVIRYFNPILDYQ